MIGTIVPPPSSPARCPSNSGTNTSASRTPPDAALGERLITAVSVTDPRHPLYGHRLEVASVAGARGARFIVVVLPDGRRRQILRAVTDLERPAVAAEPALSRISARSLLPLARLIRRMLQAPDGEVGHGNQDRLLSATKASEARTGGITATAAAIDCSNAAVAADRADASSPTCPGGTPC
jgi:hypothetical protein